MENWSSVIYEYERGIYTPEQALKIINSRIAHSTRGSVGIKRLRAFRQKILKDIEEINKGQKIL